MSSYWKLLQDKIYVIFWKIFEDIPCKPNSMTRFWDESYVIEIWTCFDNWLGHVWMKPSMKYCLKFSNFSMTKLIAKCSNKLQAAIDNPWVACKFQFPSANLVVYADTTLD